MIIMVFVSTLKELVDKVSERIPSPVSGTLEIVKYNIELNDDIRGKFIAIVVPEGVESNPTSRRQNYPKYMVSIYCMYAKDTDEEFVEAREKYLAWVDKVFDAFHLQNLDSFVDYIQCDFKLSSGKFGDMTESVIRGTVDMGIMKTAFVSN